MYITLPALVFIVILLTWTPEKISEAVDGLVKLALWLVAAIAAIVVLWFSGKFLCAQLAETREVIVGLGGQGVAALLASFVGMGAVLGALIAAGLWALGGLKTVLGCGAPPLPTVNLQFLPAAPLSPVYRDADFEAWRTARGTK